MLDTTKILLKLLNNCDKMSENKGKIKMASILKQPEVISYSKRTSVEYQQDGAKNSALGYTLGDPYRI